MEGVSGATGATGICEKKRRQESKPRHLGAATSQMPRCEI